MPIDLPHKLVCKILLDAAQASTSSCRSLCKVSTWVRHLALPLLYTTIPLHVIVPIATTLPVCPPTTAFNPARAVRSIWAPEIHFSLRVWLTVARQCIEMTYLAISHENFMTIARMMLRSTGELHVLVFQTEDESVTSPSEYNNDEEYDSGVTRAPFPQCITHLRLEDPITPDLSIHNIDSMYRLTHLAVSCGEIDEHDLMQVFEAVVDDTSVEVFVLVLSLDHATKDKCREVENWVYEMREEGEGIVYAVRPLFDDLEKDWNAEVRRGATIWERAVEYTRQLMDRMHSRIDMTVTVNLPLELVHNILVYVAESSSSSCRTLCEVSTWVRRLALPLLYTTVSLNDTFPLKKFSDVIASERVICPPTPAFCPADAVRHLCVPFDSRIFETIMRHCNNVSHLAIVLPNLMRLIDATTPKDSVPESSARQSRRRRRQRKTYEGTSDLQILLLENYPDREWFEYSNFTDKSRSLFNRITHLRLEDPVASGTEEPLPSLEVYLKHMPRLTHIAVPWKDTPGEGFKRISDAVANTLVEMYVVVLMHENLDKFERRTAEDWLCWTHKKKPWIYAVTPLYSEVVEEWEADIRGGATIWERAVDYTRVLMSRRA